MDIFTGIFLCFLSLSVYLFLMDITVLPLIYEYGVYVSVKGDMEGKCLSKHGDNHIKFYNNCTRINSLNSVIIFFYLLSMHYTGSLYDVHFHLFTGAICTYNNCDNGLEFTGINLMITFSTFHKSP